MPPQRAIIKPELLVWTREEAGLSVEEAAKKIAKTPEQLRAAEQGESQLTVRQLRVLSNAYKRPLAFIYHNHLPRLLAFVISGDLLKNFPNLTHRDYCTKSDVPDTVVQLRFSYSRNLERASRHSRRPPRFKTKLLTLQSGLETCWALRERNRNTFQMSMRRSTLGVRLLNERTWQSIKQPAFQTERCSDFL